MAKRDRQTEFHFRTWGGARAGAGRKPAAGRRREDHRPRPTLASRFPVHVTSRIRDDVPRLRNRKRCRVIRRALLAVQDERGFRICQFSVQSNHLHVICEARDNAALARGIKRLKQRIARGINRQLGRRGSVFGDRYHMAILKSPRRVRRALGYVMQNARRHGVELPRWAHGVDPYSSAWWFEGWKDRSWRRGLEPPDGPACVKPAESWLLTAGWRRCGLISTGEVPAGRPRRATTR